MDAINLAKSSGADQKIDYVLLPARISNCRIFFFYTVGTYDNRLSRFRAVFP
jgi:hypothetical protein